jgi:uncharacterized protein YbjT (DUF2867 family)
MKIFVAGATGALGRRRLPLLRAAGHNSLGPVKTSQRLYMTEVATTTLDDSAVLVSMDPKTMQLGVLQPLSGRCLLLPSARRERLREYPAVE